MICTLTNLDNQLSVTFVDGIEYIQRYGSTTKNNNVSIANLDNVYRLKNNSPFGIYTIPSNNNIFIKGIDEDGQDFHSNYYDSRIIVFNLDMPLDANLTRLNAVLYMTDKLLRLVIETSSGTYTTYVAVNGSYDDGVLEVIADSIYFDTGEVITSTFTLSDTAYTFLPLNMPKIFFGQATQDAEVNIYAPTPTKCVIRLDGTFTNPTVKNLKTGTVLTITGVTNTQMIIDTSSETVTSDGNDVTANAKGIYPSLVAGNQTLRFEFTARSGQTDGTVYYLKKVFNVLR